MGASLLPWLALVVNGSRCELQCLLCAGPDGLAVPLPGMAFEALTADVLDDWISEHLDAVHPTGSTVPGPG